MKISASALLKSLAAVDMTDIAAGLTPQLADWLVDAGMAPIVVAGLKSSSVPLPAATMQQFTAVDLSARFESAARTEALAELLDACPDFACDIGLLKGMLCAHDFYAQAHFRPMGDIDLLIPADKGKAITKILHELGYVNRATESAEYFATHHHLMPFYNDTKRVCVEVHTGLFPERSGLAGPGPFDPERIQSRLRTIVFEGTPIKALKLELQLLHTVVHWAEEFRRVGGMLGLLDTLMLWHKAQGALDWDWIFSTSTQAAHIAPLQLILGYLDRSGVIELDKDVAASLRQRGRLCAAALRLQYAILDQRVVLGKPPGAVMSDANLLTSWKTLLHSGENAAVLGRLLWNLLFPADAENRYQLSYQVERLRNLKSRL